MATEDADAALARALQAEEYAAAQAGQGRNQLVDQLNGCMAKVIKCEDELLQALALSVLPLDQLQAEAKDEIALNAGLGQPMTLAEQDLLTQKMMHWYKHSFFRWSDRPECQACGSKETQNVGTQAPTPEEAQHDAGRTEVYSCRACGGMTRFPRYNDPGKLLETRCGRCGEWANCFLLLLRAAGIPARYVLDVTDHVWCEYYSTKLARWVHLDPCEAAYDKPLLYEAGWGKQLSYIFGVGTSGFADVTRRYTRSWPSVASRRQAMPEAQLANMLGQLNGRVRSGLPQDVLNSLQVRDLAEQLELLVCATAKLSAADAALPGRTTGSLEWRQQRGETGQQGTELPQAPPVNPGVAYSSAKDLTLGPVFAAFGRLRGGACRAAGENAGEGAVMAFDGRVASKWLDFGAGGANGTSWLEYRLLQGQQPAVVVAYDLCSANDCPERDPCDWVLEGLVEGAQGATLQATSTSWTQLDKRGNVSFSARHELRAFAVPPANRVPCRALRLRITATRDPAAANSVQLQCLNLYTMPGFPGVAAASNSPAAAVASITGASAAAAATSPAGEQNEPSVPPVPSAATNSSEAAETFADPLQAAQAIINAAFPSGIITKPTSGDAASAASGQQASVSSSAGGASPLQAVLATLVRVLDNIIAHPTDAKYRRVRAAKLPAMMLSSPEVLAFLAAVGFRPLLLPLEPSAGSGEDVFLVLACGAQAATSLSLPTQLLRQHM